MKLCLVVFFFFTSLVCKSQAIDSMLISISKNTFTTSEKKGDVPAFVTKYIKFKRGNKLRLACNQCKINRLDYKSNPFLKNRRFEFVSISKDVIVLTYEHGRGASHYHCLVFCIDQNRNVLSFFNITTPTVNNLNDFINFIDERKYLLSANDHW
jgi:hypothetical protein